MSLPGLYGYCCQCPSPTVWIRYVGLTFQVYCEEHAKQQEDFGEQKYDSDTIWEEISLEERAPKHPDFIRKRYIREYEFPELATDICNMKYEQIVRLFVCLAEAFRAHSREASGEGRTDLAQLFVQAAGTVADCANSLEKIFVECNRKKIG